MSRKDQFEVLGKRNVNIQAEQKARGECLFAGDLPPLPGMLHCRILRSPYAHARVKRIDVTRAGSLPGVKAVITHEDTQQQFLTRGISAHPNIPRPYDSYILEKEPRYVGDRVAAVAAVSEAVAEEALSLIEVNYEELPAVLDPAEAVKPGAPRVHEYNHTHEKRIPIKNNVVAPTTMAIGDIAQGFQEADFIVENEFRTSYQHNCPLGRPACLANPLPGGALEVWNSSQGIHWSRMCISASLGLPVSKVKVHRTAIGGAFGLYIYQRLSDIVCCFLALKTGQPVRYEETREEMCLDGGRHPAVMTLKTGVKKNGTFTAMEMQLLDGVGAYSSGTSTCKLECGFFMSMYHCRNKRFNGATVYTNTPPLGSCRGAGNPEINFAVEQQIDIIADRLGVDPLNLRRKNIIRTGDIYYGQGPDIYCTIKSCGTEELIEKGAALFDWQNRKAVTPYTDRPWIRRGIGMSCGHHTSGTSSMESKTRSSFMIDYSGAIIKMNTDGTANVITPSAEVGCGTLSVDAAIAAEAIGLRYEDIIISAVDSDITLWDQGSMASRHTVSMGNAVKAAGQKLRKIILQWAAEMLDLPAEQLDIRQSKIFQKKNSSKKLGVDEVLKYAQSQSWGTAFAAASLSAPSCPPHFVVTFIEVEVDTMTGEIKVTRAFHGGDAGTPINPEAVRGQLLGGLHMGLGYALTETLIYDQRTGRILNPNFVDYKLLTPLDMPETTTALADTYEPDGPFGAKGIGEGALNPVPAALFNAVANAVGKRFFMSPLTPERVLKALKQ
jgi:CO/xanthine dehydrogenase Mo-binding subunit